ncbi:F0F1 ATP synthase subunit epsilon [Cereibacter sphaeroides]|jgi:F-type H+-transporting ATPase subunit epsilon|uniref:F0F1 ATP synthase subunit epsilon n=1 Tax=Cereibacter sphaeroides TaxID=1063 RepID=UPI0000664269|nr:ATP synthase F1, epsilon subunit [Cereibacter sphaeroides ATCC 17029]
MSLTLRVTTPLAAVLEEEGLASIRAEDASGGFGLLPGHVDLLTVIEAGVLRFRRPEGPWRFCAIRGGVLRATGGRLVTVACREAVPGEDLARLEAGLKRQAEAADQAARRARGEQVRLHANAIRSLMRHLDRAPGADLSGIVEAFE